MEHYVIRGISNCSKCGKRIKNIHVIDGKHYGSECASEFLGRDVSAPAWLYERANQYTDEFKVKYPNESENDFRVNFWNCLDDLTWTGDQSQQAVYFKTVKIGGKPVSVEWQHEIDMYLVDVHRLYFQ